MSIFDVIIIAIGLSMDAFAVSATNGLTYKCKRNTALVIAAFFGFFQFAMPVIGYYVGNVFSEIISRYAPIIAFGLLGFIGGKILYEGIKKAKNKDIINVAEETTPLTLKLVVVQAVATSIDALAVGVSFVGLAFSIWWASLIIGVIAFAISFAGVELGKKFGALLKNKAEIIGGIILVAIGLKILIESIIA